MNDSGSKHAHFAHFVHFVTLLNHRSVDVYNSRSDAVLSFGQVFQLGRSRLVKLKHNGEVMVQGDLYTIIECECTEPGRHRRNGAGVQVYTCEG